MSNELTQVTDAVKRNPKNPSFDGLAVMIQSRLGYANEEPTGEFAKSIAAQQKAEAFTMKQQSNEFPCCTFVKAILKAA